MEKEGAVGDQERVMENEHEVHAAFERKRYSKPIAFYKEQEVIKLKQNKTQVLSSIFSFPVH